MTLWHLPGMREMQGDATLASAQFRVPHVKLIVWHLSEEKSSKEIYQKKIKHILETAI